MVYLTVEALICPYTVGFVHWCASRSNRERCGCRPNAHTIKLWVLASIIQTCGICSAREARQKPFSEVVTFLLGQDIITHRLQLVCILMFMHLDRMGNSSGKSLSFTIVLCFNLLGLLECIESVTIVEYRHFSDIHFFLGNLR